MEDCIFCKLANGVIPTEMVYEDEAVAAFRDADPKAPVHVLIVPKKHYSNILAVDDPSLMGRMCAAAGEIAGKLGIAQSGFRLVINTGKDGGQSVGHLHIHLLGARELGWPPG